MFIYLITNEVNGKYYVGKTVSADLNRYLSVKRHAARHGGSSQNMPIVAAMRKYGVENFTTSVLATATDGMRLGELEKLWIIALDARNHAVGYNICAGGEGTPGRVVSDETRQKISRAHMGLKSTGYVRTELHRQQLHDRQMGDRKSVG